MAARAAIVKRHREAIHLNQQNNNLESVEICNEENGTQNRISEIPAETVACTSAFTPRTCSTPITRSTSNNNNTRSADHQPSTSSSCGTEATSSSEPAFQDLPLPQVLQPHLVTNSPQFRAPILGYEVIEHNDKFTAFKINVQRIDTPHESWFVFRRFTDFARLQNKLMGLFPHVKLPLPPKRWFKDNFDPTFLDQRMFGLQSFVNAILDNAALSKNSHVTDFFCLNDPPSPNDNLQAMRLHCECLESMVENLNLKFKEKVVENEVLTAELALAKAQKETLLKALRTDSTVHNGDQSQLKLVQECVGYFTTQNQTSRLTKNVQNATKNHPEQPV